MASHELSPPATDADWRDFHDIREATLWLARGRTGYNRRHEDDFEVPANQPLLFKADGRAVGCLRLDGREDAGVVRLVAVLGSEQGRGFGRAMALRCEEVARERGMRVLYLNAAPEALGFYEKLGWERHVWDAEEQAGIARDCIQMRKALGERRAGPGDGTAAGGPAAKR